MTLTVSRPSRRVLYAMAGALLSVGELIGLVVVREMQGLQPVMNELLQQRATYIYVLLTTAVVQGCARRTASRNSPKPMRSPGCRTDGPYATAWPTRCVEPRATPLLYRCWSSTWMD